MIVTKRFKFYAAHRNANLTGKCARVHGHTYRVAVSLDMEPIRGITMLFEEIEQRVNKVVQPLDHMFLLHVDDPLADWLRRAGEPYYALPVESTAENIAQYILDKLVDQGLPVVELRLQETDTSEITIKREL